MSLRERVAPRLGKMSFERRGKAAANEKKYPFIVQVPVATNGLDVGLNCEIVAFHKSRGATPIFGRTMFRDGQNYYRWCFSDVDMARAFFQKFGGSFYKTTGA
jgi:hypothetical protein